MSYLKNAWYCAALAEEVGATPFARRILDEPVLITRKSDGTVSAMSDMCPHRFAPLHQGVREGDAIECPYHGLKFDFDGKCVYNPHGSGRIPSAANIRSYPVVERQGVIWLWAGDPAAVDESAIVDLRIIPRAGPPLAGHFEMAVDYRLIIDNLLDLSHAPYLHPGTLAPPRAPRETRFETGDRSVHSYYLMRDVETPTSQSPLYPGARGDYSSDMEWIAPSTLRHQLAMTDAGGAPEDGAITRAAHLITPATATTTHYFWLSSRNRHVDDTALDELIRSIVNSAFLTEDEPMVAACQDYMAGREFFSMRPLYLESDYAATRWRRILEKLLALEQGIEPVPRPLSEDEPVDEPQDLKVEQA